MDKLTYTAYRFPLKEALSDRLSSYSCPHDRHHKEEYSIGFEQADNIAMALHVTNAEGPGPGPGRDLAGRPMR